VLQDLPLDQVLDFQVEFPVRGPAPERPEGMLVAGDGLAHGHLGDGLLAR
jgi:hypothetical protein